MRGQPRFILSTSSPALGRGGLLRMPVGVMPDAQQDPFAGRHVPGQRAVGRQARGQIPHAVRRRIMSSPAVSGSAWVGQRYVSHIGNGVGCILPSCFSTIRFQPRRAGQVDFRQSQRGAAIAAGEHHAEPGPGRLREGNRHGAARHKAHPGRHVRAIALELANRAPSPRPPPPPAIHPRLRTPRRPE
jgi:hypothetical protein